MLSSFNLMAIDEASATTITTGQSYLFNFDCSACPIPTSSFSSAKIFIGIDHSTIINDGEVDSGAIKVFAELNGSSLQSTEGWRDNMLPDSTSYLSQIFTDGLFSIEFTATEGSIDAVPYARMYYGSGTTRWRDAPGVLVMPNVPVPAAVWLFGSGLIGLIGVAKRKRA